MSEQEATPDKTAERIAQLEARLAKLDEIEKRVTDQQSRAEFVAPLPPEQQKFEEIKKADKELYGQFSVL